MRIKLAGVGDTCPTRNKKLKIFADNHSFACKIVTNKPNWQIVDRDNLDFEIKNLAENLFQTDNLFESEIKSEKFWENLFLVKNASQSQYDLLINKKRAGENIPDKTLCLADSGRRFHGQRNRYWISLPGNIHLSVFLKPDRPVKQFAPGFSILAAVSVLQTIDCIDDLKEKAVVKWVNDILIDNSKVCGFLAHTLSEGNKVSGAFLGIGLNVESAPDVEPTPFVPESTSLQKLSKNFDQASQSSVFFNLITNLARNYRLLLDGGYSQLLDIYRQRSVIIGRQVIIKPDPILSEEERQDEIIEGRVASIGNNLELFLEGKARPIIKGRLALKD